MSEENTNVDAPNIEVGFSGTTFADAEFVTRTIDKKVDKALEESGGPAPAEIDQVVKKAEKSTKSVEQSSPEVQTGDAKSEAAKIMANEKEIKRLKARFGESELDIYADAVLKHKVDGQDVDVTVQELLNNFSGKTAWDKKFTELSKEKKKWQDEVTQVNNYVKGFSELVEKKDIMGALAYVAQFTGKDPVSFRKEVRDSLLTQLESYIIMTPEERQFAELKEERDLLQQQRQSDMKRLEEEKSQQALASDLRQIQETHGLSDERIIEIADALAPHLAKQGLTLDSLTPKDLLEYHNADMAYQRVEKALENIDEKLSNDDALVDLFFKKVSGNPKMTDQELSDEIHKLLRIPQKKKPADALADKISKTSPKQTLEASGDAKKEKQVLFFNDLDI